MASSRQQTNLNEPASDVELFIIGKTGNGKSATGNNILGRQEFATNDGGASNTTEAKVAWAKRAGMIIKVVDGPGLEDTRLTEAEQSQENEKNIMKALDHCPYGFHALLLILKYGNSFTREEQKTVEILKEMFGDTLIKNHCILIFTNGENFDLNNKGKSTTFRDWCKSQTGALKALIEECGNRCLLFHNLTKEKSDSSLKELLEILKVQTEKNRRFTPKLLRKPEQKGSAKMATASAGAEHSQSTFDFDMSGAISDVDLVLIGKTGHGKSATGNYLLGGHGFDENDSGQSGTRETNVAWSRRMGKVVKIVDMPGLADTHCRTTRDQMKLTEASIRKALVHCPDGFHALLFVLKYGNSFTQEEQQAVTTIKGMLGPRVITNHCVLIFTHGDSFDLHNKDKTFEGWCQEQKGDLGKLIKECEGRCLLFYNRDQTKSNASFRALLEILKIRIKTERRYSSDYFKKVKKIRNEFIAKECAPELWETAQSRIMLMIRTTKIFTSHLADKETKMAGIKEMKEDAANLQKSIQSCQKKMSFIKDKSGWINLSKTIDELTATLNELDLKLKKTGKTDKNLEDKIQKMSQELESIEKRGRDKLSKYYEEEMEKE